MGRFISPGVLNLDRKRALLRQLQQLHFVHLKPVTLLNPLVSVLHAVGGVYVLLSAGTTLASRAAP